MLNFLEKAEMIQSTFISQFNSRLFAKIKSFGASSKATSNAILKNDCLLLYITDHDGYQHSIDIPIPFISNTVLLIKNNEVERSICPFFIERTQKKLYFLDVVSEILFGDPSGLIDDALIKGVNFISQLSNAVGWGTLSITIRNLQKAINSIINQFPVHKNYMNSWAMNHRLIIIDFDFETLTNPADRHKYQIEKNRKYFSRGWTSIGLSDGSLANKNYILTKDLRHYSPFALKHHNPQRNLYSTLGMEGDEYPLIKSLSMQKLFNVGISRTGWNLFTAFADVPDNWEDQLIIDRSLISKYVERKKKYQVFGDLLVSEGDILTKGQKLSISEDGECITFKLFTDKAWVDKIQEIEVNVGGVPTKASNITVKYRRNLKDGTKITNLAANKGVVRIKDLGYAIDPRTGNHRKIEVLVSCKAAKKRNNKTQILEALINNIHNEKELIFEDDIEITEDNLQNRLVECGFDKSGQWECCTYTGNFKAVVGKVFWGITKDVEDAIWDRGDTSTTNGRGLRGAGLKFSTVEFRALDTWLGKNNTVADEIMGYMQGTEDLHDMIKILKVKQGIVDKELPIVNLLDVIPADTTTSSIIPKECIIGSVLDENYYPDGFMLSLPEDYMVCINSDNKIEFEGLVRPIPNQCTATIINMLYIPSNNLRKCWRHQSGKFGLNDIGSLVNNIVDLGNKFNNDINNGNRLVLFMNAITIYFNKIAKKMSTKSGELSIHGMAVRYPHSIKAVATLSNSLPKNTVAIHREMAKDLKISNSEIIVIERFPCTGFPSIRFQKLQIIDDPLCRFTIRVSKNSLGSSGLDFDGDVIFGAAFHTPEAKEALLKAFTNPNKYCYNIIKELNNKMGQPRYKEMSLADYHIKAFEPLTNEEHAEIVNKLTGVKSNTGPVIALAYNIMRIVENSYVRDNQKINCAVEFFLDKVANSIFKQKHGVKALSGVVVDAICTGNVNSLVDEGFRRSTSQILCNIIKEKAAEIDVFDLIKHHEQTKISNTSNIINLIVRKQNRIYFASRASLETLDLLKCLESPVVDIPSKLLHWSLAGKSTITSSNLLLNEEKVIFKDMTNNYKNIENEPCSTVISNNSPNFIINKQIFHLLLDGLRNNLDTNIIYKEYDI